jgi:predicted dehydrogenase
VDELYIGILGASRIAPLALVAAAEEVTGVAVAAVGSRDRARAESFAAAYGIPRAYHGYEAILGHDDLDAVYIALPASEHAKWTSAALTRGLHVLVEKPMALNAPQAERVINAAAATQLILMEGFHWRYHPLAEVMIELTKELSPLSTARAQFEVSNTNYDDIRWQLRLGGGALMDLGCYAIHWLRSALAGEPVVLEAHAETVVAGVDGTIEARLRFPDGVDAQVRASMLKNPPSSDFIALYEAEGAGGFLRVTNPVLPQTGHLVEYEIAGRGGARLEVSRRPTYSFQLEAFRAAVCEGTPPLTGGSDSIANMRVMDAIYAAAGFQARGVMPGNPSAASQP